MFIFLWKSITKIEKEWRRSYSCSSGVYSHLQPFPMLEPSHQHLFYTLLSGEQEPPWRRKLCQDYCIQTSLTSDGKAWPPKQLEHKHFHQERTRKVFLLASESWMSLAVEPPSPQVSRNFGPHEPSACLSTAVWILLNTANGTRGLTCFHRTILASLELSI